MCYNSKAVPKGTVIRKEREKKLEKSLKKLLTDGGESAIIARLTSRGESGRRAKPRAKKLEKSLKKFLTKRTESAIINKLSERKAKRAQRKQRGTLKIEQH